MKLEEAADLLEEANAARRPVFDTIERDYRETPIRAQDLTAPVRFTACSMEVDLKAMLKAVNAYREEETLENRLALEDAAEKMVDSFLFDCYALGANLKEWAECLHSTGKGGSSPG